MLLLLLACAGPDPLDSAEPEVPATPAARCGDGALDPDEACDDGADNDDATPDACRTTCLLPTCGDGVVDGGEACDDAGTTGGDGCDPACAVETGTLEVEPNDTPAEATPLTAFGQGALPDDDVDCWSVALPECGAVRVTEQGACGSALTMGLYDPDGSLLAVGAPDSDGCATLDPADQPGARWVAGGSWAVCVQAVNGAAVPGYGIAVEVLDPLTLDLPAGDDLDTDGTPDSCDVDRDGDGVADIDDTCPDLSNGPDTVLALGASGYVRSWIAAGPFTGDATTDTCRPAEEERVGEGADGFAPTIGDAADDGSGSGLTWRAHLLTTDSLDLTTDYAYVDPAREAYAMVYLRSDTARQLTLAVGADDGVFAWWNSARVLDIASCQGVNADQFQAPVDVVAGWNTLLLKVRDQGGGWGLSARLLGAEGAAVTDLSPSLDAEGTWRPDQTDTDGDGVGDACDDG
jgi:cysteine-rich repeat protein